MYGDIYVGKNDGLHLQDSKIDLKKILSLFIHFVVEFIPAEHIYFNF